MGRKKKAIESVAGTHLLPSDLLTLWRNGVRPVSPVSLDTETSGLYVDDGARMSTVSIAFADAEGAWVDVIKNARSPHDWGGGIYSREVEVIDDDFSVAVVSFAWPFDQGVSSTGKAEDDGYLTMWPDAENLPESEWVALMEWALLVGESVGLVFHHAKFDLHICAAGCRRWPGLGVDLSQYTIWDTQNGCRIVYPTEIRIYNHKLKREVPTTSLKPTAAYLWGVQETDEAQVIKEYLRKNKLPAGRWDLIPWEIMARYAEQDARLTTRLHFRQLRDIERGKVDWLSGKDDKLTVMEAMQRTLDVSLMLFRIERRGLPFDTTGALEAAQVLKQRAKLIEARMPFHPVTLPAAKKYWFGSREEGGLGFPTLAETATGAPQVNEMIVGKMIDKGIPGAEDWRDLQKLSTADDRWYSGYASMAGSDGRLRATVRQNGTVSARFSVERVQLQAIPHDYRLSEYSILEGVPTPRELIASGVPKGFKQWELDLAQAELRVAAMFANCVPMLRLIDEGADLHSATAEQLFNIDNTADNWGFARNTSKRANFGLIFGLGADTFKADLEKHTGIIMSLDQAAILVKDWNGLYPEFKQAIYRHQSVVERRMRSGSYGPGVGWVDTINGERRWFTPGEETHKAFNQRVQPNLAQFGLDWWLESEKFLMDIYGDEPLVVDGHYIGRIGMVMTIHDSQILLLPDTEEAAKQVQYISDLGVSLWSKRFPGVPGGVDAKEWGGH